MIQFEKYHGAGNDFIMIDLRDGEEDLFTTGFVKKLCDRHLGIGADGLILLLPGKRQKWRMKYFNADGKEGSMCGNGGRAFTGFAHALGLVNKEWTFEGIDGDHLGIIEGEKNVRLRMNDVLSVKKIHNGYFLDTGSPHYVEVHSDLDTLDVYKEGKFIRSLEIWGDHGSNVNFIRFLGEDEIMIRTFERGVENETLACGTGAVASAITAHIIQETDKNSFLVRTRGGTLRVEFSKPSMGTYRDVWLEGEYEFVFSGEISSP